VCISWKADDTLKRLTFNLSLCSPDPEAASLIAGGEVLCNPAGGEIIGFTSPPVGAVIGNPVAIEIWSIANIKGKPASGTPFWHWAFPYVKVRWEGDREFTNGALANAFTGQALGNEALADGTGLNPDMTDPTGTQDFVTYKCALVNPFSYVRAAQAPQLYGFDGPWTAGCVDCATVRPTGATAGSPGAFTPTGSDPPTNLADLRATTPSAIVASPTSAWTIGQHVVLADSSHAHWDGDSWEAGNA